VNKFRAHNTDNTSVDDMSSIWVTFFVVRVRGFLGWVRWCDEVSPGKPNQFVDQMSMFRTQV